MITLAADEVWNVVKFYLSAATSTDAWVGTFMPTG